MSLATALSGFKTDLFKGQTILVSGASSGIGLEIARGFAALGGQVIATGTADRKLEAAQLDANNAGILFHRLDVRDSDAIRALIDGLPALNVVINAAGISHGSAELSDEAKFLDVLNINLAGMMRISMAARAHLVRSRGVIINIASMLSYLVEDGSDVVGYTASKTGVLGLTRALAHSYGRDGIRVNAISPGYHKTDMTKPLWSLEESEALVANRTALKRWGTTDDLVGYAIFLASPAAVFITATDLPIDGGYVVGNPVK